MKGMELNEVLVATALPVATNCSEPPLALRAPRRCTNLGPCALLASMWCALVVFGALALGSGNPQRLWYGTDYLGNICGQGGDRIPADTYRPWEELDSVAYPVGLTTGLGAGVCVSRCPLKGDDVLDYNGRVVFVSEYNHFSLFRRCVPLIGTGDVVQAATSDCTDKVQCEVATNATNTLDGVDTILFRGIAELGSFKWPVILSLILVVLLCIAWVLSLHSKWVAHVVAGSAVLFLLLSIVIGVLLFNYSSTPSDPSIRLLYKIISIVLFFCAGVLVVLGVYYRVKFPAVCALLQKSASVQMAVPSLASLPMATMLCFAPLLIIFVILATYIETEADLEVKRTPANGSEPVDSTPDDVYYELDYPASRIPIHVLNFVVFVWSGLTLRDCGAIITSMTSASWYWSAPSGEPKSAPRRCVSKCAAAVLRYHIGTAAAGSMTRLVAAPFRLLLFPFALCASTRRNRNVVKRDKEGSTGGLNCCTWISEVLSDNAYVMTAVDGSSFVKGCTASYHLLTNCTIGVGGIQTIVVLVMFLTKALITWAAMCFGWVLVTHTSLGTPEGNDSKPDALIPMVVVAFGSWILTSFFVNAVFVSMGTILLCFCIDVDIHDGSDSKPFYTPKQLRQRLMERNEATIELGPDDLDDVYPDDLYVQRSVAQLRAIYEAGNDSDDEKKPYPPSSRNVLSRGVAKQPMQLVV